jgi:hypothetical protein
LKDAQIRFQRSVGSPPVKLVEPPKLENALPLSMDFAREWTLSHHPGVQALRHTLEASRMAVKVGQSDMGPRFDLEVSAMNGDSLNGYPGYSQQTSMKLVARQNLFHGGADQGKVRELKKKMEAAEHDLADAELTTTENVMRAWAGMETSRSVFELSRQYAQTNQQVLAAYQAQFDVGRRSLLDLLNGENEALQSKSDMESARLGLIKNQYHLLIATGRLRELLGVELPPALLVEHAKTLADKRATAQLATTTVPAPNSVDPLSPVSELFSIGVVKRPPVVDVKPEAPVKPVASIKSEPVIQPLYHFSGRSKILGELAASPQTSMIIPSSSVHSKDTQPDNETRPR